MIRYPEKNMNFLKNINIDDIILKTIEDVLIKVIGKKSYNNISKSITLYSIKWNDVPNNAKIFSNLLMDLLGPTHVKIEEMIIENIYENIGLKNKIQNDYSFHRYIGELKNQYNY